MLLFKLAFKNLLSAGLRTWLNVIVLSFSYVVIIFYNGLLDGWNEQARKDSIAWQFGQGQLWHKDYDPYDAFFLDDAHGRIPAELSEGSYVPVFIQQASIYPQRRMQTVVLKGIPADQQLLKLPTSALSQSDGAIPVVIGRRMAEATKLKEGDEVTMRWRDKNGTFDVRQLRVAKIFQTDVPAVDNGQIWIDLQVLYELTGYSNEASLLVLKDPYTGKSISDWEYHSLNELLKDIDALIQSKRASSAIIYIFLLALALLAIFDTQVLSIFRRQKEIGTYIALGMTRGQVVRLFTIEGGANSILGALLGAVYGAPVFIYFAQNGIGLPQSNTNLGITLAERMYPVFGAGLVLITILLVVLASTIVSYLPSRKISKMDPTLALKGKIQ